MRWPARTRWPEACSVSWPSTVAIAAFSMTMRWTAAMVRPFHVRRAGTAGPWGGLSAVAGEARWCAGCAGRGCRNAVRSEVGEVDGYERLAALAQHGGLDQAVGAVGGEVHGRVGGVVLQPEGLQVHQEVV